MADEPKAPEQPDTPQDTPKSDDSWKQSVPEKYRRDTLEDSLKEWNKGWEGTQKVIGKKPEERLSLSGNGPINGPEEVIAATGLTQEELLAAYEGNNGKLPDDVADKIKASGRFGVGLVEALIDREYVRKQASTAQNDAMYRKAVEAVGGENEANLEIQWARTNLPADEREELESLIFDENGNYRKTAGRALKSIRASRLESLGSRYTPSRSSDSQADIDTSDLDVGDAAALRAFMADPKFGRDEEYTARLDKALAAARKKRG